MLSVPEEVKTLYKQDSVNKNLRIHFPNGEHRDLVNSDILFESAKYTESVCTNGQIKLGISEASMFECSVYDVPNLKGMTIDVDIEIDITSLSDEFKDTYGQTSADVPFVYYSIPYGQFIVYEYKQKAESLEADIVAYDALALEVLRTDIKTQLVAMLQPGGYVGLKKFFYYFMPESYLNDTQITDWLSDITVTYEDGTYKDLGVSMEHSWDGSTFQCSDHYEEIVVYYRTYRINVGPANEYLIIKPNSISYSNSNYSTQVNSDINNYSSGVGAFKPYPFAPSNSTAVFNENSWSTLRNLSYQIVTGWDIYTYTDYYSSMSPINPRYSDIIGVGSRVLNRRNWPSYVDYSNFRVKRVTSPTNFQTNGFDINLVLNKITALDFAYMTDVTSGLAELLGLFCRINKVSKEIDMYDIREGISIYPSDDLYPADDLYPHDSGAVVYYRGMQEECDWQNYLTKPVGRVHFTYGSSEGNAQVPDYDPYLYSTIEISNDNFFLNNGTIAGGSSAINTVAEAILEKVRGIYYRPYDGNFMGLPWMETGDAIRVQTTNGFFDSFIMRRTLSGIQLLRDNLSAEGEE